MEKTQNIEKNIISLKNSMQRLESPNFFIKTFIKPNILDDLKTQKLINEDLKLANETLRKEKDLLSKKTLEKTGENHDLLLQIDSINRENLSNLQQKDEEIDKLSKKLFSNENFGEKTLRKKKDQDFEFSLRLEIEAKNLEIDKIREFLNNLQRENEVLKGKIENLSYDYQREIRSLKNSHKIEINELKLHISALEPEKNFEKSSQEMISEKKREIEDLKKKFFEKEQMITKLRKEKVYIDFSLKN